MRAFLGTALTREGGARPVRAVAPVRVVLTGVDRLQLRSRLIFVTKPEKLKYNGCVLSEN